MPARLARAAAIVEEAARAASGFFARRQELAAATKRPQDFVSEADTAVERLIRDRLAAAFPGEPVVGEELGGEAGDAFWIIDPIDGTANFLRGSPLWGISLGFVRDGRPELGVVALPVFGEVFAAASGAGVFLASEPFVRHVPFAEVRLVSLGDSLGDDIRDVTRLHAGLRRSGWVVEAFHSTSVAMVFAARGHLDGHLQKRTTLWDIAGGSVICSEAGLDVRIGRDLASGMPWVAAGTPGLLAAAEPLWPELVSPRHP